MRAIILAAGVGSRLAPYTESTPKCLLTVCEKSIIDYQLEGLSSNGITDIGIVLGHYGEKIKAHVESYPDLSFTFIENPEYKTTNSAHSLYQAREYALGDPEGFLVFNSDLIFTAPMLKKLIEAPEKDAIVIDTAVHHGDMCNVRLEGTRVLEMSREVPMEEAGGEAVGPIRFSQAVGEIFLDRLANEPNNWVFYVLSVFAKDHHIYGIEDETSAWIEIDTPEELEDARAVMSERAQ